MRHKRTQHATESLASHHRGQLRIHVHTRPNVKHDKVVYYIVRHGTFHHLGKDFTNRHGNASATFHKKPGKTYRVKAKVFATSRVKHDYTRTHRIKIHH